ncbi:MAG: hypothetical protein A2Z88_09480 [Omnitrophica WOR_2 bacterium GWA2_47_8]|nr:MAG: hypothetical protein A2Z88_09480 [Omnitrophica WOR_2 bacterium GWA2_47_8]
MGKKSLADLWSQFFGGKPAEPKEEEPPKELTEQEKKEMEEQANKKNLWERLLVTPGSKPPEE